MKLLDQKGLSLLELTVGMVISAILISGMYQTQRYFSLSANREQVKAILQQDIVSSSDLIEKDIRMSGYGLPGNGIDLSFNNTTNDNLIIYSSMGLPATLLKKDVNAVDSIIPIAHVNGLTSDASVCFQDDAGHFVYRLIKWLHHDPTVTIDTINVAYGGTGLSMSMATAHVFPAQRISYCITNGKLTRIINKHSTIMSYTIDSLRISAKDSLSAVITSSPFTNARSISVTFGGHVGSNNQRVFLSNNLETFIRNRT